MKLDFVRNTRRNMAASALNSAMRLMFPFLNRTLFLWLLGPEYLGLNGLFTSVLSVLMLAELGFGSAVVCSMYKLVADDDRALICAYLRFYRTVYRWVGAAIFALGLCLLPFLGRLVHGDVPPDVDLRLLYLIHLVNTAASYFLFAYRGSVLGAYNRNDVITNIRSAVMAAQYVVVFLLLLVTRNYYHYVIATVAFTVLQNVLLVVASRRLFPGIEPCGRLPADRRRRVMSDVKSIFLHKVGGVISYSVDNVVISAFFGLVAVAAYGNYYYVVTSVGGMVMVVYSTMAGGFGNKIYTETREENFALFMRVTRLAMVVVAWCAAMMAALYQPFMRLWTKGDPTLVRHALTPALMVLYFWVREARQPLLTFKSAAALWRQDRMKPVVSGAANLVLSIAFVICLPEAFRLDGVIFATILTFAFIQMPWETLVLFTNFFSRRQMWLYFRQHGIIALWGLFFCAAAWGAARLVPLSGLAGFFVKAAAAGAVTTALAGVAFRRDIPAVLRALRRGK